MSLLSLEVEGAVIHVQSTTQDFSSVTRYENLSTYGVSTDKLVNAIETYYYRSSMVNCITKFEDDIICWVY